MHLWIITESGLLRVRKVCMFAGFLLEITLPSMERLQYATGKPKRETVYLKWNLYPAPTSLHTTNRKSIWNQSSLKDLESLPRVRYANSTLSVFLMGINPQKTWHTSSFSAGDILIFDVRAVHASTINTTKVSIPQIHKLSFERFPIGVPDKYGHAMAACKRSKR